MNLKKVFKLNPFCILSLLFFLICVHGVLAKNADLIKGPPEIFSDRNSQQKVVNEGKDVKLTCPVAGNPQPIYEWWKDSDEMSEDAYERIRIQRNSLKIKQVTSSDSGMYTCKGVNGFGNEKFIIYLNVQAALGNALSSPSGDQLKVDQIFPMAGTTLTKLTGQSVRFKCLVTGEPDPDITWFKDGRILNPVDYPRDPNNYENPKFAKFSLHLSQLSNWDSGNYSCEVINIHGTISVNWTLNIVSTIGGQEKQEVFPLQMSNQTAVSGDEAVLKCSGSWDSEISPKVKWLRRIREDQLNKLDDNQTFNYKGNFYQVLHPSELLVLDNGVFVTKLVIKEAKIDDSGMYVCTATNRFGLNFKGASLSVIEGDSNLGHKLLIIGLSSVVFLIVVIAIIVTLRKKKAKRIPPQNNQTTEQSKVQMEAYGRPLLPPPLVSDRAELQPRYVIYPPPGVTSPHPRPLDEKNCSAYDCSTTRLHQSMDQMSLPSKSNESNASQQQLQGGPYPQGQMMTPGQPIVVYQDTPRSMYISSTPSNRYHLQNFNVI